MTSRPARSRPAMAAVMAATALTLASACSDSSPKEAAIVTTTIPLPTTAPAPTTTVAASPRTVVTLPSELGPGPANVAGTVSGPGGFIAGATVRVERLVDDSVVAATTIQSGADGRWAVDSVNGGRYRLRAWRPPDMAMLTPVLVFVTVENPAPIDLPMLKYPSTADAVAIVVPNPPVVGQPATLVVSVANGGVDSEGILHTQGRPGVPVVVGLSTNVVVNPPNPNGTDANGNAGFIVTCAQAGPVTGTVTLPAAAPQPIQLPACAAP